MPGGGRSLILGAGALTLFAGVAALGVRSLIVPGPGRIDCAEPFLEWRGPSTPEPLAPDGAAATFELVNTGGQPVRILKWESSCGCTVPRVEPTILRPGERGSVYVKAAPRQIGEQVSTITLTTDSPVDPTVALRLRVIGTRRPPYLAQTFGELVFRGVSPADQSHSVYATTVQPDDEATIAPRLDCDLPFVVIGPPSIVEEKPSPAPGVVERRFRYEVRLAGLSDGPRFAGTLRVIDPWDASRAENLRLHVEVLPVFRASPARLRFRVGGDGAAPRPAKILVMSEEPAPDLVVESGDPESSPLELLSAAPSGDDQRLWTVEVGLKPGHFGDAESGLVIRRASAADRITIPVTIRREGS